MTEVAQTPTQQVKAQSIKASEIDPKFKYELQKIHGSEKIALALARDKPNPIKMVKAQALITICPFCHIMYDTNELRIEKTFNEVYSIPILHYPQLLGLAMSMSPEELAFGELRVNAQKTKQFTNQGAN
jgi:heterodisulfide reductase subunit B